MTDDEFAGWLRKRNAALETMDMGYLRSMMPSVEDETVLVAAHKARYDCRQISRAARLESAEWLRERGYKGLMGMPLLPPGELPE